MESALQERFCCRNQNPVCTLSTSLSALPPGHSCPLAFHLPLAVGVPGTLPPRGLSTTPFHCSWLGLHAGGPCSSWGTPPPTKPGGMPYSGCSETPPAQPGSVWVLPVRPNTLGMPPFRRQNTTPLCNKHNTHQRGIFLQERYFVPFFLPTSRLSTLFIPHCLIIYNF